MVSSIRTVVYKKVYFLYIQREVYRYHIFIKKTKTKNIRKIFFIIMSNIHYKLLIKPFDLNLFHLVHHVP